MWQRFTERARRTVFFAQEEAGRLGYNEVNSEHLLLGLVRESDSTAGRILENLNISPVKIRKELEKRVVRGPGRYGQDMQLTDRAKRAIDLAYDTARDLNNNYIGTEHVLMGLLRENGGQNAELFQMFALSADKVKANAVEMQGKMKDKESIGRGEVTMALMVGAEELKGRDLLSIADLSKKDLDIIFDTTRKLKDHTISPEEQRGILKGKTLAMIFEKPSLRTRVSFETGIFQLGGHGIYLGPNDISLGKRESVGDVSQTLDRMVDIIMARVFEHDKVTGLAQYAKGPVINGLSDFEHPCQALADFYTIIEHKGKLEGLKLAYVGDGNNVAHSLMLLAAKVGTNFAIGCPEGYEPDPDVVAKARMFAKETGAAIEVLHDAAEAVKNADVVYTDVWASMGQEEEAAERAKIFAPFQVNTDLMAHAKEDAIFEHCLPAHRGSEVTDEVVDGKWSVVFDEAENRLHAQKAVMVLLAG